MLKKIAWLLAVILVFNSLAAMGASTDAAVVATYTAAFGNEQGVNNWYFCEFAGQTANELIMSDGYWHSPDHTGGPFVRSIELTPTDDLDIGYKFVSPEKGMVRLRGEAWLPYDTSKGTDGIKAVICKGKNEIWSGVATYGSPIKYDFVTSIKEGQELQFRINCNGSSGKDWTRWYPTVEYLALDYKPEAETNLYFQKKGDEYKQLEFDEALEGYPAEDGIAFISAEFVRPSDEYTMVRRYTTTALGRCRVQGMLAPTDERCGGTLVSVIKSGEKVWEQLFPEDEKGFFDVRMRVNPGEVIDVEVSPYAYTGYNYAEWSCDITESPGTFSACVASTSQKHTYSVLDEFSLGSLIGTEQGAGGVSVYTQKYARKIPMTYSSADKRWNSAVENDIGYVSAEAAHPGNHYDTVIEVTLPKSGILRIDGDMLVSDVSDGVVSRIALNGDVIWSSRVGGERPVRWDEPYDVSYFNNTANAVARVQEGDVLTFTFNQWRKSTYDKVDISNVMLRYIEGNVLSQTTKWKLDRSIVVDTKAKSIRANGQTEGVELFVKDGTTYISKAAALKYFPEAGADGVITQNGVEYLPLRSTAEGTGKSVVWTADRLVIIHDGIPVLFGWAESSEIELALEGGVLFD